MAREEQVAGTGERGHGHWESGSVRKPRATMFRGPQVCGFYPKPPEEFKQGTHPAGEGKLPGTQGEQQGCFKEV